jgi:hypothetical protein
MQFHNLSCTAQRHDGGRLPDQIVPDVWKSLVEEFKQLQNATTDEVTACPMVFELKI